MKASRLRVHAGLFIAVLLLATVVFVTSDARADGDALKDALQDYSTGNYDEALTKLRAYVEGNPEDSEIYAVLLDAENRVLLRALAQGGEHERLIKYLLDKSKPEGGEAMSSDDEIKARVDEAVGSDQIDVQRRARVELRRAGELAVPHLIAHLGSEDADTAVNAILALRQLHSDAAVPLSEALNSDDARVRGYAATVLGDIGDARARAAVARVAAGDEDPGAKSKAAAALAKLGGSEGSVADVYVALGRRYYGRDVHVIADFSDTKNIWRWEEGSLARYSVPAYLYPYQMAEECAADALALDPAHMGARALLVRSLMAQKIEGEVQKANGGEAPEGLAGANDLAASQGFAAAGAALSASLAREDWDVAVECCYLCAQTYGGEDLVDHPVGHALAAPQKRVRYAAAIAALRMSPKRGMPNADKVVALGAQAASESAIRQAMVIDDNDETRSKILMALHHGGIQASGADRGTFGVMRAKNAPALDVIVVRADLGAAATVASMAHSSSYMVIDELIADARTKGMKVIVLVGDTSSAKADAIREGFQSKYGEAISGFISEPIVESAAFSTIQEAANAKDLNVDQERANALAASAAGAFAAVDFSCKSFDLSVAIEPLSNAATDGPTAEVKLNAVKALGNLRVGGGDALLKALTEGDSDELKAAAATALGSVLSAVDGTPEQIEALIEASAVEGAVGSAALAAVGQVRHLTPEQRRKLFETHRLQVMQKAE
ncbi:MAG: HEAT repeat domain-containing protein [Planctomycetota bacterium]|nr:HEAT repeat domain-containing protein [Planctomycetota bacterium]